MPMIVGGTWCTLNSLSLPSPIPVPRILQVKCRLPNAPVQRLKLVVACSAVLKQFQQGSIQMIPHRLHD